MKPTKSFALTVAASVASGLILLAISQRLKRNNANQKGMLA